MADVVRQTAAPHSTAAGHLSIHFEFEHPPDVPFLFEQLQKRIPGALAVSVFTHVAFVALALLLIEITPATQATQEVIPPQLNQHIIWLAEPGPGGGGGGGGNRTPAPPRKAELPGRDKITVPVSKPPALVNPETAKDKDEPKPDQQLNIPAKILASGTQSLPGLIGGTGPSYSAGPGTGGGAGTGTGTGMGPGTGSGLGPGWGGGFGGGAYQPGSGIELPRLLREVKPQYTADAMRAKVQGVVLLECVVLPDGTVGEVRIVRSLDPVFGLDQEAVKAAKQWRFIPGTRQGQPVPVLVTIELTFTLR